MAREYQDPTYSRQLSPPKANKKIFTGDAMAMLTFQHFCKTHNGQITVMRGLFDLNESLVKVSSLPFYNCICIDFKKQLVW
jgi:hypothetical protein